MKMPKPITWLFSFVLFLAAAFCLSAADIVPGGGGGGSPVLPNSKLALTIPVIVPLVLAFLKNIWPAIPKVALPFLCPVIGALMSVVISLSGQTVDPATAAALGAVGNWLRELYDQSKKAVTPVAVWVGAACAFMLAPVNASAASGSVLDQLSVSPFVSYRVHELGAFNGKFGGGLAAGYALNKQVTLEAEVIAERFDDSDWGGSLTEAGANFKIDIFRPKASRPISPYLLIGYTRNLDIDENRMNAGAGIQLKFTRNLSAFADGRWTHNFGTIGHALFRGGLSYRF